MRNKLRCWIVCLAVGVLQVFPVAAITFTNDTIIGASDTNYEGEDIVVTNCTLTVDGPHSFGSLQVLSGGKVTHSAAADGLLVDVFTISGEQHTLIGTNGTTLDYPSVILASVVVRDLSGLITYSNGMDYLVSTDGSGFTAIQRLEAGTIADGAIVSVDYGLINVVPTAVNLNVAGDVSVELGGSINVSGAGYAYPYGVGRGGSAGSPASGGGGGHGGYGGLGLSNAFGGGVYGAELQPVDKGGSGGSGYTGPGGRGGGAIRLMVGGMLRLNGSLNANGASATNSRAGGGAGGSIYVTASTITGSGVILCEGGAGEPPAGGGGGGGRIALVAGTNTFSGMLSARGGSGWRVGGAGTIYKKLTAQTLGDLVVDNGGRSGSSTLLSAKSPFNLTIKAGGNAAISSSAFFGSVQISSNAWMTVSNTILSALISVSADATIDLGGAILADGAGFAAGQGNGAGRTLVVSGSTSGGGGGYGGFGGRSSLGALGGIGYGSVSLPVDRGSGGGNGNGVTPYSLGGAGGGTMQLTVSGVLTVNGRISANGVAGIGEGSGGGSGGSIRLTVGGLAGAGQISANGGQGNGFGGGGGGGRIAINYQSNLFAGMMVANGAMGGVGFGGAGTILTRNVNQSLSELLVDNGGNSGTNTLLTLSETYQVKLSSGAFATLASSASLSKLSVGTNSTLTFSNSTLTVSTDVEIQLGGAIVGDATGSLPGLGQSPGRNALYTPPGTAGYYTGGGGGNGGYGASSSVGAGGGVSYEIGTSYGSAGSGGGAGSDYPTNFGGGGGGAITLNVNGQLLVNGRLSANGGTASGRNAGGGSGGSISLSVKILAGSGLIAANGGAGNELGGGGGGGRIAISYLTNLFSGQLTAWGGGTTTNIGGAGVIFLQTGQLPGLVLVDNAGRLGTNTDLFSGTMSELVVRGGAILTASARTIALNVGTLSIGSNSLFRLSNQTLTVSNNAVVDGGMIADGTGFPAMTGQGAGRSGGQPIAGGGGGYGGCGGSGGSSGAFGGIANGFVLQNPQMGSGGGNGSGASPTNAGGAGGGLIRLTVNGTLQVNGRISANGATSLGTNCGGGSGGSLVITAGSLAGAGVISANGGAGTALGGGGGGGRISIFPGINQFVGVVSALGGSGLNRGGAGTIFTRMGGPQSIGLIVVDNGGLKGTNTFITDPGSFDLTVGGGGIFAHTATSFSPRNLMVLSNGWVGMSNVQLFVSSNANVQKGGGIIADAAGFFGGSGPGAGVSRGGAGYGGGGGANTPFGGRSYGSLTSPVEAGSGGANGSGSTFAPFGGSGGGALRLNVTGSLAVDGRLSSDGGNGDFNSGGGSGGAVWVTVGTLFGSGLISANGGAGGSGGGGGGGGRISITYNTNFFTGTLTAFGGNGTARGGAGTIYQKATSQSIASVVLDNGGFSGTNSDLGAVSGTFDLVLTNGAQLLGAPNQIRNFSIGSNSWLNLSNKPSFLTLSGALTVHNGGGILADGGSDSSLGAGGSLTVSAYGTTGGGGGHGGFGAASLGGASGGVSHDLPNSPTAAGGRGGSGMGTPSQGGAGGGIVSITAPTVTLNGRISANGFAGTPQGSGGGAGGSIALNVGTISGSGIVSANGGAGNGYGGGGAGGRIAITYSTNSFTGPITAYGGGGFAWGGAGTVYLRGPNQTFGRLIVNNGGHGGTNTPIASIGTVDLTIGNGAVVYFSPSSIMLSNLTINAGGTLTGLRNQSVNLSIVRDTIIDAGASIILDGLGYLAGTGPGAGRATNQVGSGAGYGGNGGASAWLPGGPAYGSVQVPTDFGSGGGLGFSSLLQDRGHGGGALRMTIGRNLVLNGGLSVNGNFAMDDDGGGGSGGSVLIAAAALIGNGVISTDGGSGNLYMGGGGAGGRIALYLQTNHFTGSIAAYGGDGYAAGADGTIFFGTNFPTPSVVAQSPTGLVTNGVGTVDLFFNTALSASSVSFSDAELVCPGGFQSAVGVSTTLGPSLLRVAFPLQTTPGEYRLDVGPEITDMLGRSMAQAYHGSFSISVPVITGKISDANGQGIGGVLVTPTSGSSALTDTNGLYLIGVDPGSSVTVQPSLGSFAFVPATRTYSGVTNSIANQDYLIVETLAAELVSTTVGTNLVTRWQGIPGVTYQPFYSTNLVDWLPYGGAIPGSNGVMQFLAPINLDPAKFFLLRTSAP